MKFLFAVLGAVLGGMIGGPFAALVGVAAGLGVAIALQRSSGGDDGDSSSRRQPRAPSMMATALDARLGALEREVATLRSQVQRLSQGAPGTTPAEDLASSRDTQPRAAEPAGPAAAGERATEHAPLGELSLLPELPPLSALPALSELPAAPSRPALADTAATLAVPAPPAPPISPAAPVHAPAPDEAAPVAASTRAPTPPRARRAAPPAPPPLRERMPPFLSRWIFGGNTIVKVGVLILFLGLAFLLRYAAERVSVPIELRYAGVGLIGAVLLVIGWRLRERADAAGGQGYGVILQGAGIGVFYLTALAAIKLHPLLAPALAFAFMAMVAVLGAVLAVAQNAPWLALVSIAEGFAAPVLVSTGGGNHIALFTYLAILDVGIFLMAWSRAWRALNLVGAVGTFTLAAAWAQRHYSDALYPSTQAFLLLFFGLFTAIGVLFARRALAAGEAPDPHRPLAVRAAQALGAVGRVDSTLAFGVPLAAYGLQYLMVKDREFGPAWAAFGFAVFYLLLGGAMLRGRHLRYALLGEAYVIVSVIFATLTVPLALEGTWTGATWAVEAAGMYWLGARQHRVYARFFAFAVLAGATLRMLSALGVDLHPGTPLLTGSVLGMALLGASAAAMQFVHRRMAEHGDLPDAERVIALLLPWLVLVALTSIAWMLCTPLWASVLTAGLGLACMAAAPRLAVPLFGASPAVLHTLALAGLSSTLHTVHGKAMFESGWQGLLASSLIGIALLATGWLGVRRPLQAAQGAGEAPAWSLGSSLGLLAGLAVLNLGLLYILPAEEAAFVWPWVGLAALWFGLRLAHPALPLGWLALQAASALALLLYGPALWPLDGAAASPLRVWGPLMLTVTGFIAGHMLNAAGAQPRVWVRARAVEWAVMLWSIAWWAQVLPPELHAQLAPRHALSQWPAMLTGWVMLSSMLMVALARWRRWLVLGQATWGTVPAWILTAAIGPALSGLAPSAELGWMFWPLALIWHGALLHHQAQWWPRQQLAPLHVMGFWLFLLLAARECQLLLADAGAPGSAWPTLGWMLVPALVLLVVTRERVLQRWPFTHFRDAYLVAACAPVALYLLLWLWVGNTQAGNAAPLPYVPLLNPLEIGQGLVLLALALWLRVQSAAAQRVVSRQMLVGVLGATAFALYTGAVLRTSHHWAGVPWSGDALFHSTLTQAALSVAWSVVAVGVMLLGHRRVQRAVWTVGAALLGVVVVKLFLIELADRGGLYRIVSFIVVGVLLLVVGYFAPVPPKREEHAATAAG